MRLFYEFNMFVFGANIPPEIIIFIPSSIVIFVPDGKHNPLLNKSSETPFTYELHSLNTGCKCIGFQSGRASILSFSRCKRNCSLSIVEFLAKRIVVSQKFEKLSSLSSKKLISLIDDKASL